MAFSARVCVFLVVCLGVVSALYGPKSDVILLNSKNFDKEIMKSNHVWIVEFFAPWCGHCKQLTPAWEQAAKKLKGIVKIAAVDADAEKELGGRFGIKGFPTIKVFTSPVGSKSADKKKTPVDYNGGRTAKDIVNHAISLLPTKNVAKVDSLAALEKLDSSKPRVLLFSEKATSPPMFTSLSLEFYPSASFGFVKSTASEVASKYGVSSFPTVIVVPAASGDSESAHVAYDGELKPDALLKFLNKQLGSSTANAEQAHDDEEKPKSKPKPKPKPVEEDNSPAEVVEITTNDQLHQHCEEKKHLCLLAFLDPLADPTSQDKYLSTLKEVAEKHKKSYSVVWIDSAKQPDFFAHFQPADLPCLRVWNKKKGVVANVVASLTADHISRFLGDVLTNKARSGKLPPPPALIDGGAPVAIPEPEAPLDDEPVHHDKEEL